jgi:hypothetical protein
LVREANLTGMVKGERKKPFGGFPATSGGRVSYRVWAEWWARQGTMGPWAIPRFSIRRNGPG